MEKSIHQEKRAAQRSASHMPKNSIFYERVVPILLAVMGLVTVGLILFAAGVLFGLVKF